MILVDTNIIIDFWDKPTDEVKNILEENDLKKAKTLIEKGNFAEIMNYMLEKIKNLNRKSSAGMRCGGNLCGFVKSLSKIWKMWYNPDSVKVVKIYLSL